MFDERWLVSQLLEGKQGVLFTTLENNITLSIKPLGNEEYSILPYYGLERLVFDEIGYGILHTCAIINEYRLRSEEWAKAHIKNEE